MKNPYLTGGLICVFVLIDLVIIGLQFDLSKSDWASWVQAMGSIGALAVAIFVMDRQNQNSVRLMLDGDKRADQRRAAAVSAIVERAHMQLENCLIGISAPAGRGDVGAVNQAWVATTDVVHEIGLALSAIPAHELGGYDLVIGLQQTIEALRLFKKAADSWKADSSIGKNPFAILNAVKLIRGVAATANETFQRGLRQINA